MKEIIAALNKEILSFTPSSADELEQFRILYLGKKGKIQDLFADFKNVAPEERKEIGILLNDLKNLAQQKLDGFKDSFQIVSEKKNHADLSKPADFIEIGSRHPLSLMRNEIISIFSRIGLLTCTSIFRTCIILKLINQLNFCR